MRAVLLGAGHAHLYTIRRTAPLVARGMDVTLVAPDLFWYSGLATGVLGGQYPPELDQIDVGELAVRGGGRFLRDRAVGIDAPNRTVRLESGSACPYDVLSLNLGTAVRCDPVPGMREHALPVKPVRNLLDLRNRVEGGARRIVVAGGGPAGCEVAANLEAWGRMRGAALDITLLTRGERILPSMPEGAADAAWRHLSERSVRIATRARVTRAEAGAVFTETGDRLPFDVLVNATGLVPPPLLRESGLTVDRDGALLVDGELRSVADPRILGGGECVAPESGPLPRVGVYAIRQAPILFENLLAAAGGGPTRTFVPQKKFLLILNLGGGIGLAVRGNRWWYGRLAFRLKDWIDRRFLREVRSAL